jgi:hypothetical protein
LRDPDIVEAFTDEATGIELEQIRTSDDLRGEFPHIAEFIWGAWHPAYMGKPGMAVGASADEALRKLLARRPELAPRKAA